MNIPELYQRPAFNLVSLAHVPMSKAGAGLANYLNTKCQSTRQPALQALAFYYLDHCVALIKSKYPSTTIPSDLGDVVNVYHHLTTSFGMDMYAYLLLICNREFRYCKTGDSEFKKIVGDTPAADLGLALRSTSSSGALAQITSYKGNATLGSYCEVMTTGYNKMSWSNCYGGKKWGDISKVLENYALGRIPLMTLLDQSFSLQHNTCAIFNKGTVYAKESSTLLPMLDLQHAGQIIALVHDMLFGGIDGLGLKGLSGMDKIVTTLKEVFIVMAQNFDGLDTPVDWDAVLLGKHASPDSKLAGYKKDWYSHYGIYDGATSKKMQATKEVGGVYTLAPNEVYKTVKRNKL